jgi:branched-chain amino acid transport system substrate-binding protein
MYLRHAVLGCALVACAPEEEGPIPIGALYDLSPDEGAWGDMSSLDKPSSQGALLAAEQLNAAGGVLGRSIEIITMDSTSEEATVEAAADELVRDAEVVAAIGFSDSNYVLGGGPVFQAAGTPFVTSGATSPALPASVGDMMFLACFGDNVQAAAGAEFGLRTLGQTTFAIVDDSTVYTTGLADYFTTTFAQGGGTLLGQESYGADVDEESDVQHVIDAIAALPEPPDFVYLSAIPTNVHVLVVALRRAGVTAPIVGGDGFDAPDWILTAEEMLLGSTENVYFSTHALMDPQDGNDRVKQFISDYGEAWPGSPPSAFSALGYDAVMLVAEAIRRANSAETAEIKRALEPTQDFHAITGAISLSASSHIPSKGVTIVQLINQRYTLASEFVPEYIPPPPR